MPNLSVDSFGLVRDAARPNYPGAQPAEKALNNGGEALVSLVLPAGTELSRLGFSYQAISAAVAPVVAIPTTAALLSLFNGEPDGGKSYVIDSFFLLSLVLTAAAQPHTILANLSAAKVPTASIPGTSVTPKSLRGGIGYRGRGIVAAAGTNAIAADGWFPVGTSGAPGNASTFGQGQEADAKGLWIIPPGCMLNLSAISTAATGASIEVGLRWHEVQLVLP